MFWARESTRHLSFTDDVSVAPQSPIAEATPGGRLAEDLLRRSCCLVCEEWLLLFYGAMLCGSVLESGIMGKGNDSWHSLPL